MQVASVWGLFACECVCVYVCVCVCVHISTIHIVPCGLGDAGGPHDMRSGDCGHACDALIHRGSVI